ncbi:MAG: AmmeMemoRadiSam system protein B, partial [Deltaproteobacteria bacterium]|nr:AmmeMemoRadiSam system protein B [Deltaproteobacteria bacterium]MBW2537503.1 AmmeMemoRadiSam system protein B [Deltaproteobacteria bacterium]
RPAALAGSWYPGGRAELGNAVDGYLQRAALKAAQPPIALISPHAGYRFSGPVAAHGYRAIQGRSYGRVFLIGPAHRAVFDGVSIPDAAYYETPLGAVPLDRAVADRLVKDRSFRSHPTAHAREHCLEIQLPFLQRALKGPFAIVPMLVGRLDREQLRRVTATLREVVAPGDLVIASSDFTHYGPNYDYVPFREQVPETLARYAAEAWSHIERRDVDGFLDRKDETGDTICGYLPIAILLGLLPDSAVATKLAFDTSGNVSGDYANSVSYLSVAMSGGAWAGRPSPITPGCVAAPTPDPLSERSKATAHIIARRSLELWVRSHQRFDPDRSDLTIDEDLARPLGVFVTLEKNHALRGCIGNILPKGPLHQAIAGRAVDASQDGRFSPVTPDELEEIEIEISVLTVPTSVRGPEEIVLGRHGIIVRKQARSAVFLPQVAPEQGWTLDETLTHLSRKAGLGADGWRQGARFEVFEALVF